MAARHHNTTPYNHKNDKKILAVLLILLGIGWALFLKEYTERHELHPFEVSKKTYECPDAKYITAAFSGNIVNLELSDGRNLVLNHPLRLDSKYRNLDESMVFWTEGKTAHIEEGDVRTYQNCIQK